MKMRLFSIFKISLSYAAPSEHFVERCSPNGYDLECRLSCAREFAERMKDRTTDTTNNWALLELCREKVGLFIFSFFFFIFLQCWTEECAIPKRVEKNVEERKSFEVPFGSVTESPCNEPFTEYREGPDGNFTAECIKHPTVFEAPSHNYVTFEPEEGDDWVKRYGLSTTYQCVYLCTRTYD